jgi:hypothetical protein
MIPTIKVETKAGKQKAHRSSHDTISSHHQQTSEETYQNGSHPKKENHTDAEVCHGWIRT